MARGPARPGLVAVSIQRIVRGETVRYRARVKSHGREVATRVFTRKSDAVAWEHDQRRSLRAGEWIDPRRARMPLARLEPGWRESRQGLKRKSLEADLSAWRNHVEPKFGDTPLASITRAQVEQWVGSLIARGVAPATARRYLATLRSVLAFAVADNRLTRNPAVGIRVSSTRGGRREGQFLTHAELDALADACRGTYGDVVLVLGLCGLRWGELAGLKVADIVQVPGPGLRIQRTVLASSADGALYEDTPKTGRVRTVPLPQRAADVIASRAEGRTATDWIFAAPAGGPLSESNWKRSVAWVTATEAIGRPGLRVHDLRHTAASLWLASGADPKVVQRVLGHASAAMTMDLYGHLIDQNLWDAADRIGGKTGARAPDRGMQKAPGSNVPRA